MEAGIGKGAKFMSQDANVIEVRPGVLRVADTRFSSLPDFPFEPHYAEVNGLRVHYLDEGPKDGKPVFLMHGEPSWCFLYRKMIPVLVKAGFRCLAPDLIGFGRSDKLDDRDRYTYQFHVDIMNGWFGGLDLAQPAALFGQDWGGLIGIRMLIDNANRFDRLIVGNTGLPTGDQKVPPAFHKWLEFSQNTPVFHVGGIIKGGCATSLSSEVIAAYDAPFPTEICKEGARKFPALVPITPDDPASEANRKGWEVLKRWPGKVLTLFSDRDPVTAGGFKPFQKLLPGAQGQPHEIIEGGGHFLQEDRGEVVAEKMAAWLKSTSA
jgi:haloalkane dehalogenase